MDTNSKDISGNGDTVDYIPNKEVKLISCFLAGHLDLPDDVPAWLALRNPTPNSQTNKTNSQQCTKRKNSGNNSSIPNKKYNTAERNNQFEELSISPSWEACSKLVWEHTITYSVFNRSICQNIFVERIRRIGQLAAKALRNHGFFSLKGLLGPNRSTAIYNWAITMRENLPHTFRRGELCNSDNIADKPIRTDQVAWFGTDKVHSSAHSIPGFSEVCLQIYYVDAIVRAMGSDVLGRDGFPAVIDSRSWSALSFYKRQQQDTSNPVGYVAHYDNPTSLSDGRVLTALYYLNPVWQKQWGGQLVVLKRKSHSDPDVVKQLLPISILPTLDRLVLFYSDERTLHSVQPVSHNSPVENRVAIGTWYFDQRERDLYLLQQIKSR